MGLKNLSRDNVNDVNKEMAKMLYATAEQIIGKVKCRRFTGKAKWFTREIKEERMKRKILNKKQRQMRKLFERHRIAEVEWQGAWDEYKVQQKKVKRMIYEARVKDERQKVENIRNKGPD
ncbi:hypothetical protein FHG87_025479 [Trinorchestia longiramus]|nr:hypothetical protein FHG87_025479 [Trinorchestia longiramus]